MSKFLNKFKLGGWNIGFSNQSFFTLFSNIKCGDTLHIEVQWMRHKYKGSFYADPFIYESSSDTVKLLAEEFFYNRNKGIISLLTINRRNANLESKSVVLEETCHLSYPYYDKSNKNFTPESYRNGNWAKYDFDGNIALNKCVITDFPIIDATPIEHKGLFYVFATKQPNALDELLIYYSEKREGPYRPHPLNPIKKDIKTSRCGGAFFSYNGELFRPVQDSTHRYGETMHIMRITELSPTYFLEELYCHLTIDNPGKYSLGFHTLNFNSDMIIVDGYREVYRPLYVMYIAKILPLIKKLFNAKH